MTEKAAPRVLAPVAAFLTALAWFSQYWVLRARMFVVDELEHLHAAWCLSRGLLPYRDFFEHHTPLYHAVLALGMLAVRPESSPDRAVAFLFLARGLSWAMTAAILALTWRLAREEGEPSDGWTAAALLACTPMFLEKALEVRPDLPAVLLLLGAALLLKRSKAAAGALLGASVLCSQKALFALPGLAAAAAFEGGLPPFALGFAAPLLAALGFFAAKGAAGAFLMDNVVVDARWKVRFGPGVFFRQLARQSPALVALALAGAVVERRRALTWTLLSLAAGLFIVPVPYPQYYFYLLPFGAALAALALGAVCRRLMGSELARQSAAAAVLALVAAPVLAALPSAVDEKNAPQLELIRWVQQHTSPAESVLDGWTGLGAFRPHAYYYWFFHGELRAVLPEADKRRLADGLRAGTISPSIVALDRDLRAVSPDVAAAIEARYEPAVGNVLWRRRQENDKVGRSSHLGQVAERQTR